MEVLARAKIDPLFDQLIAAPASDSTVGISSHADPHLFRGRVSQRIRCLSTRGIDSGLASWYRRFRGRLHRRSRLLSDALDPLSLNLPKILAQERLFDLARRRIKFPGLLEQGDRGGPVVE